MSYSRALSLLLDGDVAALARLLGDRPDLARARSTSVVPPYDGYFHGATLLHHVAGNPRIRPLGDPMVPAARALLDAGADVDAVTLAGPSQPGDIGWTTLGLVATSGEARLAGLQVRLLDLLIDAGADLDARNGGALMGALYYGESGAARHLAAGGARVDLIAAAGIGDPVRTAALLALSDEELASAPRLAHYARVPWPTRADPAADAADLRAMALVYAALHGQVATLGLLLDAGVDPNHRPPFEHGATPLHWAVMGDRPEAVRLLVAAGSDPGARDREFGSTPAGWAAYLGRPEAAAALVEVGAWVTFPP